MLPNFFGKLNRRRAPWGSIIALAIDWAVCLNPGFEQLVTLDVFVYGLSLALEFSGFVVLQIRELRLKHSESSPTWHNMR